MFFVLVIVILDGDDDDGVDVDKVEIDMDFVAVLQYHEAKCRVNIHHFPMEHST